MLESNWKNFTSKVILSFNNGNTYIGTGVNSILQVDIKKELANNNTDPLGVVSANTIGIKLLDKERNFIKNNKLSPYYGMLNDGFRIEYYTSLDGGEFKRNGTFYATDIKNNVTGGGYNTVNISGADILQYVGNTPVNIIGIKKNITVKQYLESIFNSVGLSASQYNVDSTLDKEIKYTYTFGIKLKEILNNIAQSYMCNIYVDNNGIIQVIDLLNLAKQTNKMFMFDGTVNTFSTSLGTNLLDTYNAVKIDYVNPTVVKDYKLLEVNDLDIPAGTNELSEFTFNNGNKALTIDYVSITTEQPDVTVSINGYSATQNSIILNVTNPTQSTIKVKLEVYGNCVTENNAVIERFIGNVPVDKRKYININAKLIQSDNYANEYANIILKYLSYDGSYIELKSKGNPLLELADIVGVKSNELEVDGAYILRSIKLSMGTSYTFNCNVLACNALLS